MFSAFNPRLTSRSRQASAAAPAPEHTSFVLAMSLPTTRNPFNTAAPTMMAVPCWSSWNTGIFMRSRSILSTWKHSGAFDVLQVDSAESGFQRRDDLDQLVRVALIHFDIEAIDPGEFLEEHRLAFHHRLGSERPDCPSPSTAVPLVSTPIRFPRAVSLRASAGSRTISSQAAATPGVYASARSRWFSKPLVGVTEIFPGGCRR